ncbi:MAG TPA: phage tail protein [Steroidobacter sp.]
MLRRSPNLSAIGQIPSGIDPALRDVLSALKQIVEVREGRRGTDMLDKGVTYRDLVRLGLIEEINVPRLRSNQIVPVAPVAIEIPKVLPPGTILILSQSTIPSGYRLLKANGAAVSRSAYAELFAEIGTTWGAGDGETTFNLPDIRGEFIRIWDDGRGVDAGRVFASWQADENKLHSHAASTDSAGNHAHSTHTHGTSSTGFQSGPNKSTPSGGSQNTSSNGAHTHTVSVSNAGGNESRPRNLAFLAVISY